MFTKFLQSRENSLRGSRVSEVTKNEKFEQCRKVLLAKNNQRFYSVERPSGKSPNRSKSLWQIFILSKLMARHIDVLLNQRNLSSESISKDMIYGHAVQVLCAKFLLISASQQYRSEGNSGHDFQLSCSLTRSPSEGPRSIAGCNQSNHFQDR